MKHVERGSEKKPRTRAQKRINDLKTTGEYTGLNKNYHNKSETIKTNKLLRFILVLTFHRTHITASFVNHRSRSWFCRNTGGDGPRVKKSKFFVGFNSFFKFKIKVAKF